MAFRRVFRFEKDTIKPRKDPSFVLLDWRSICKTNYASASCKMLSIFTSHRPCAFCIISSKQQEFFASKISVKTTVFFLVVNEYCKSRSRGSIRP